MSLSGWSAIALGLSCVLSTAAGGQTSSPSTTHVPNSPPPAVTPAITPAPCCKLPALTPVELQFVDAASSRTSKPGEMVALKLAEPLTIDGRVVAPAGSHAMAEIIQASKSSLMGKAGELTFAARWVEINGARVPLKRFGFGRSQGNDPSGTLLALNTAAAVALPVAAVALIFVSGGNVDIKAGARAHAVVAAETFVPSNP